jgi:HAD superfamily hydrolase (TIGR01490 family)
MDVPAAARPRFAFLDLDGTLTRANLAHVAAHHQVRRQSLSGRVGSLAALGAMSPALLALDLVSRSAFQELLYKGFRGISADRLRWLGEHAAEHVYEKHLRAGARDFLARLRKAGIEPVLVTGSLEHVVAPFCERLGIAHFAANRLEIRDESATGRLVPPLMSGARKAAWIRDFAEAHGAVLSNCHACSDSASDLPMLAVVGHPCVVHPDRALALEARAMHWPEISLDDGSAAAEPLIQTAD